MEENRSHIPSYPSNKHYPILRKPTGVWVLGVYALTKDVGIYAAAGKLAMLGNCSAHRYQCRLGAANC